jgi:hypothetical protein
MHQTSEEAMAGFHGRLPSTREGCCTRRDARLAVASAKRRAKAAMTARPGAPEAPAAGRDERRFRTLMPPELRIPPGTPAGFFAAHQACLLPISRGSRRAQ